MKTLRAYDAKHLIFEQETAKPATIVAKGKIVTYGEEKQIVFENPYPKEHPIYEIHQRQQIHYIREQSLSLSGVVNFRDIGGYLTMDGRQVKHGIFYRSAPLVHLSEAQKDFVDSLQLQVIYDFRSTLEITGNEDYVSESTTYKHVSGIAELDDTHMHGNFDFATLMQQVDMKTLQEFFKNVYRTLPFQNPAYQQMMKDIEENETPMLFHCSAGKDRTGFASALLLKTLGVDDETLLYDYLLSNDLRKSANESVFAKVGKKQEEMESFMLVYSEYLQQSFACINEKYGNFETYLLEEFGIDRKRRTKLKNHYLYKNEG